MVAVYQPPTSNQGKPEPKQRTLWNDAVRRFTRNQRAVLGMTMLLILALTGILAPLLAPYDPMLMDLGGEYVAPNSQHPLGTDELGRDVLSRILYGTRNDLAFSLITVFLSATAGLTVGTMAGYFGGALDMILMRTLDVLFAFPAFLLGLALVAFVGPSTPNVIMILAITSFPRYARLIRGSVLSVQRREYVEAARAIGSPDWAIIVRHILPNSISPIIVYATLDMGSVITALAGLSFLGVGIQPPTPDWGLMLTTARNNLFAAPWTAIFPGIAISLAVISFNFMGDGLRDALDPRMQRLG